ncbi:MAG: hypothetical protein AVDCRST_MAG65-74 [uncultured Solirubrobacteraceae bacterium]|uniref:Tocopherol cyclase n=1 Tax=uncultured Solirubrobacteraceae bacterium TaxID=1162706 RepID=A0A6J4R7V4_9ACTN|nr:MAG: hypothetical protein AVDCRST_MAG65-74 [uncultured Solirubrobacteraceae bacterium]
MPSLQRLIAAYRRTGADLPFGDPTRAHGVGMEGYYWRFTDASAGRVVVVLCGISSPGDGDWALVALASHPDGVVRAAVVPRASAVADTFGVRAGTTLTATREFLSVDLGAGARLEAVLSARREWPHRMLGGLGPAQMVPGLGQYWHPHLLGAAVSGSAELGGRRVSLDAAGAYAEKNWGSHFADHWWWGQAHGFDDPGVCVAFAGGRVSLPVGVVAPTAVVVALDGRVLRLAPPLARTVASVGDDSWRLRARQGRVSVSVEGSAGARPSPALLPVPVVGERRAVLRSRQLLAGRLELEVRRGGRRLYAGVSELAGLERPHEERTG